MKKDFASEEFQKELDEKIKEIVGKISRPASEIILDDVDLREMLKISRRTALEYRRKKIFKFYKLENKIYYFLSEVIDGIKKHGGCNEIS